jgi:hypothetical protein
VGHGACTLKEPVTLIGRLHIVPYLIAGPVQILGTMLWLDMAGVF